MSFIVRARSADEDVTPIVAFVSFTFDPRSFARWLLLAQMNVTAIAIVSTSSSSSSSFLLALFLGSIHKNSKPQKYGWKTTNHFYFRIIIQRQTMFKILLNLRFVQHEQSLSNAFFMRNKPTAQNCCRAHATDCIFIAGEPKFRQTTT